MTEFIHTSFCAAMMPADSIAVAIGAVTMRERLHHLHRNSY
ncbi:MAG: hypothetical protein ACYS4W_01820 [Planctomycetota bacterium]